MVSLGLALREGTRLSKNDNYEDAQRQEWYKDAHLRDLVRQQKEDQAADYFREHNVKQRELDAAERVRSIQATSALAKYRTRMMADDPEAVADYLNETTGADKTGRKFVVSDKDGFTNGLTLSVVDANGNVLTTGTMPIKSGSQAFSQLSTSMMTTSQFGEYQRGIAAKEAERQHDMAKIDREGDIKKDVVKLQGGYDEKIAGISAKARTDAARITGDATRDAAFMSNWDDFDKRILNTSERAAGVERDKDGNPYTFDVDENGTPIKVTEGPKLAGALKQAMSNYNDAHANYAKARGTGKGLTPIEAMIEGRGIQQAQEIETKDAMNASAAARAAYAASAAARGINAIQEPVGRSVFEGLGADAVAAKAQQLINAQTHGGAGIPNPSGILNQVANQYAY